MSKEKPTVLIVEDENLLLAAITKKLEVTGITPLSFAGGSEAIDYLNSHQELPDAIWLDYHLKDMDGLMFMGKLKENDVWAHIPVVVVSNSASEEKVHSMLALGAKKYILKAEHRLDDIITVILDLINN